MRVTFFNARPDPQAVEQFERAGVDGCLFYVPADAEPDSVEGLLDELKKLR